MIEPKNWMPAAVEKLDRAFGPRLLYVGLQGSYRRGEATEDSDIDLVVVLDRLSLTDLDAYRETVRGMPEGDKACGFLCGREELAGWPRHELFQFRMDTDDYRGVLAEFVPPTSRRDIREGARVGAANLQHLLVHGYLYAEPVDRENILAGVCKGAFFVLQSVHYLRSGRYCAGKQVLAECLAGHERDILAGSMNFAAWLSERSEAEAYELLLRWCGDVLKSL